MAAERAIYLHEIQDPGNLGTILRTLAWFGNFRFLLSPGSVDPYNPKVVRSSMGAIFHAPMELDVALDSLRTRFARIACLDMQGEPVQSTAFTTFECYLFGNEARGVPRDQLNALGARPFTIPGCGAIESLNLTARATQLAGALSGGWKQRLALAACMLHDPELLLLDEPTAGVDPKARREFWAELHALAARGVSVLVSTHYMDEAERCHRLAYIAYGRLMAQGTADEIVASQGLTTFAVYGDDLA